MLRSDLSIPPGETLEAELTYRGISRSEFATKMEMTPELIDAIIVGERVISARIASKLQCVLG